MSMKAPTASNVDAQQCANELVTLIRKLRWMGMEDEARRMEARLRRLPPHEPASVIPECGSTD
jgi:hypothetical protein